MSAWDIAWRIGFFVAVSVAGLWFVVASEKQAAEKFDTDWRERR